MSLPLTPQTLAISYEFLRKMPPFRKWHLPFSHHIEFRVIRRRDRSGDYEFKCKQHVIRLSEKTIGHTNTMLSIMAHEMVHLYQRIHHQETLDVHNKRFIKLANQVCAIHGWDPKSFV